MATFTVTIGSNSATSTYTETTTVYGSNGRYTVLHAFSTPSIGYGSNKTFSVPNSIDLSKITVTNVSLSAPSSGGSGTYSITPSNSEIKTRLNNGNRSTTLTYAFQATKPSNYSETVIGLVPTGGTTTRSSTRSWSTATYTVTYTENASEDPDVPPEPEPVVFHEGRLTMQDYRRMVIMESQPYTAVSKHSYVEVIPIDPNTCQQRRRMSADNFTTYNDNGSISMEPPAYNLTKSGMVPYLARLTGTFTNQIVNNYGVGIASETVVGESYMNSTGRVASVPNGDGTLSFDFTVPIFHENNRLRCILPSSCQDGVLRIYYLCKIKSSRNGNLKSCKLILRPKFNGYLTCSLFRGEMIDTADLVLLNNKFLGGEATERDKEGMTLTPNIPLPSIDNSNLTYLWIAKTAQTVTDPPDDFRCYLYNSSDTLVTKLARGYNATPIDSIWRITIPQERDVSYFRVQYASVQTGVKFYIPQIYTADFPFTPQTEAIAHPLDLDECLLKSYIGSNGKVSAGSATEPNCVTPYFCVRDPQGSDTSTVIFHMDGTSQLRSGNLRIHGYNASGTWVRQLWYSGYANAAAYNCNQDVSCDSSIYYVRVSLDAATANCFFTFKDPLGKDPVVFGGEWDASTGEIQAWPYYDSYNGETLVGPWASDLDEYVAGTTPTIGAKVVDMGGTPTVYNISPLSIPIDRNTVWYSCPYCEDDIVVKYLAH